MRRISTVLFGLVVLGGAVSLAAGTAAAAPSLVQAPCTYGPCGTPATIGASVSYGPDGVISLAVTGSGFQAGERVNLSITRPSAPVGSIVAGAGGSWSATVVLPAGVPAGSHELVALGSVSGETASTTFTTSAPSGALQPCPTAYHSYPARGSSQPQVVLAAAYTTACVSQVPGAVGRPASGGTGGGLSVASPSHATSAGSGSTLPFTGADEAGLAALGAAAVCAGGLLVLSVRRRRDRAFR